MGGRRLYFISPNGGNGVVTHQGRDPVPPRLLKTTAVDAGVKVAKANAPQPPQDHEGRRDHR